MRVSFVFFSSVSFLLRVPLSLGESACLVASRGGGAHSGTTGISYWVREPSSLSLSLFVSLFLSVFPLFSFLSTFVVLYVCVCACVCGCVFFSCSSLGHGAVVREVANVERYSL